MSGNSAIKEDPSDQLEKSSIDHSLPAEFNRCLFYSDHIRECALASV
jgi:hypothetical protein